MIHSEGRPKIAIVDPNTLAAMGLKQILQDIMPIMSVDNYGSFLELEANQPDQYFHYFVAMNIVLENRAFFRQMGLTDEQIIRAQVTKAILDLAKAGKLQPGAQLVIGCSTSEIAGGQIGKASAPEIGEWVAGAVLNVCGQRGFVPIFQCCEHLNRSLVMPLSAAKENRYVRVNAIPQPKAGGSVPAAAWKQMEDPCLVMAVQADAGLDIGDTLIGMHLRPVAVPARLAADHGGYARVTAATTRPKYIGGSRAQYE